MEKNFRPEKGDVYFVVNFVMGTSGTTMTTFFDISAASPGPGAIWGQSFVERNKISPLASKAGERHAAPFVVRLLADQLLALNKGKASPMLTAKTNGFIVSCTQGSPPPEWNPADLIPWGPLLTASRSKEKEKL